MIATRGQREAVSAAHGVAGDRRSDTVSNDVFTLFPDEGASNVASIFGPLTSMQSGGIEAVFIANRQKLLGFLIARGAGDAAEDLVQDLWLKITGSATGPVANPLSYLYRAANTLMIDRYRSRTRSALRDGEWLDSESENAGASPEPVGERVIAGRQEVERVTATLAGLGPRRETVFRRARIDGVQQRQIAVELGISLSTVENDLRIACRALANLKEELA